MKNLEIDTTFLFILHSFCRKRAWCWCTCILVFSFLFHSFCNKKTLLHIMYLLHFYAHFLRFQTKIEFSFLCFITSVSHHMFLNYIRALLHLHLTWRFHGFFFCLFSWTTLYDFDRRKSWFESRVCFFLPRWWCLNKKVSCAWYCFVEKKNFKLFRVIIKIFSEKLDLRPKDHRQGRYYTRDKDFDSSLEKVEWKACTYASSPLSLEGER